MTLSVSRGEGFSRLERLRKRRQFLHTRRRGQRAEGRWLVVYALRNDEAHPRLGVTVSKRVGNAAVRNRWKRRLREIFRRNKSWFGAHDVIIIVKRGAQAPPFDDLGAEVQKTVHRALRSEQGRRNSR